MIRLTLDTNVVVSGLLWSGHPARLLDFAQEGQCKLFTSIALLTELRRVLQRPKFAAVLSASQLSVDDLVLDYAKIAVVIHPTPIAPVILHDPADDQVLSCGESAIADLIVSGDSDLLSLKVHRGIMIVGPSEAVDHVAAPPRLRQSMARYVPSVNTSR